MHCPELAGRSGPPRARLCSIVARGPTSGAACYASPGGTRASNAAVRSACCVCGVSRGGPGFACVRVWVGSRPRSPG